MPVELEQSFIEGVRKTLPELPDVKRARFVSDYILSDYDATILTDSRPLADYYEAVVIVCKESKLAANWVMGDFSAFLNKDNKDLAESPVSAEMLGGMLNRITDNTISGKIAKTVFEAMWAGEGDVDTIVEAKGLKQVTDTGAIEAIVDEVMANNTGQVEAYKSGKEQLFGFFVGQVMKASKGKANPAMVNELLKTKLNS